MKRLAYLLMICALFISCGNNSAKNDHAASLFKSSEMKVYSTTDSFGEIQKTLVSTVITLCNERGDTISQIISENDDRIEVLCKYDDNGNLLEKKVIYNEDSTEVWFTASYDKENRIVESYDNIWGQEAFVYDESGNVISRTRLDAGVLVEKYVSKYDESNRLINVSQYDKSGNIVYKTVITYNADGNRSKEIKYQSDGKISEQTDYFYDENKRLISTDETSIDHDFMDWESHSIETYTYDVNGNQIRQYCETDMGTPVYEYIYEYDNENHLICRKEHVLVSSIESKTVYTYDVDGHELSYARYKKDGSLVFKRIAKYNEKGLPISFENYKEAETLTSCTEFTYEY